MNKNILSLFIFILIVFALLIIGCTSEQKPASTPATVQNTTLPESIKPPVKAVNAEADAAKIRELENQMLDDYRRGDTIALKNIMDDDFTIGLPNGKGFGNRRTETGGIHGPVPKGYLLHNDTMKVWTHGDIAIVTRLLTERGNVNKRNVDSKSFWTDSWVRIDTVWKLIASHGSYLAVESYEY